MRFWHLFISAAILSSCSVPDGDRMPILIDAVIDGDTSEYSFRKGDRMGLYAVCPAGEMTPAGNCVDNAGFTYDGSSWSSERQILWTDDVTPADLYCYCPYRENLEDAGKLVFETRTSQDTEENYHASEFLYGKILNVEPTAETVKITARSLMSRFCITVLPGAGYTEERLEAEGISICLVGLRTAAEIDLVSGTPAAAGEMQRTIPLRTESGWKAMIVPQKVTGWDVINMTVGGKSCHLGMDVIFEPGKMYSCTITVDELGDGVNLGIDSWEDLGIDYGGNVD